MRSPASRVVDGVFSAVVSFVAWLLAVALVRCLVPAAPAAAWALATFVALVAPIALDAWITRRYRRLEARAHGTYATTLVVWNGFLLLAIVLVTPQAARAAMPGELAATAKALHLPTAPVVALGEHVFRVSTAPSATPSASPPSSATPSVASATPPPDAGPPPAPVFAATVPEPTTPAGRVFRDRASSVVVIHTIEGLEGSPFAEIFRALGVSTMRASGSGFVAASDDRHSLIVTNHHVAGSAQSLQVVLKDGRTFGNARVVAKNKENDLALVEIDAPRLAVAPLAEGDEVQPGARAIAIGAPLGLDYTLTEGIVSARRTMGGTSMIQTQTTIDHGSSGGPLLDESGRIIGVNTATKGDGLNLAVSVKHVRELLAASPQPKALKPFRPGPTLKELTVEGGSLSAIDRMQIEDVCNGVLSLMDSCLEGAQAKTTYEFHVPVDTLFPRLSQGRRPDAGGGGADGGVRCFEGRGEWFGEIIGMQLRIALGESVKDGGVVRMVFETAGQDGGAPRQSELRFVFEKEKEK